MKAVVRSAPGVLEVDDIDAPVPGKGQVLVRSLVCGICGSDLHALHHLEHMFDVMAPPDKKPGAEKKLGKTVFGHQFCAEIVDYGTGTNRKLPVGSAVVSMPYASGPNGIEQLGYSQNLPGGFAEYMVLDEGLLLPVPNGLSAEEAAMVEPIAVGEHAVNAARFTSKSAAMVIGCGQIGLSVIATLKSRGFGPVIAVDFSERRRKVAEKLGADIIIDPSKESPHARWTDFNVPATLQDLAIARYMGDPADAIIFECVGKKGLMQKLMQEAPPASQFVVVGVCMETDYFEPVIAAAKELSLRFVIAYNMQEFANTLTTISEGRIDAAAMISNTVGLSGVADAFDRMKDAELEVTVLVDPRKA
jgi:threonine dehydrogenase-like Zn-dependent dehydrogenase